MQNTYINSYTLFKIFKEENIKIEKKHAKIKPQKKPYKGILI